MKHGLRTKLKLARRNKHRVDLQCRDLGLVNRELRVRIAELRAENAALRARLTPPDGWNPGPIVGYLHTADGGYYTRGAAELIEHAYLPYLPAEP